GGPRADRSAEAGGAHVLLHVRRRAARGRLRPERLAARGDGLAVARCGAAAVLAAGVGVDLERALPGVGLERGGGAARVARSRVGLAGRRDRLAVRGLEAAARLAAAVLIHLDSHLAGCD